MIFPNMPYYSFSNEKPYISSWLAVLSFCLFSSIMYISLSISYILYSDLDPYVSNSDTMQNLISQNFTEFTLLFMSTFTLVFLFLFIYHKTNFGTYYLALFQFYYYFITFGVVCFLRSEYSFSILVSEFMLLQIQQGLIMTVLLTFTGREIDPIGDSVSLEHAKFHFENWWRLARLGMTGILSISIGAAITVTVSDSSMLTVSTLLANLFLSSIPGTVFLVVIIQKMYWINNISEKYHDNGSESGS